MKAGVLCLVVASLILGGCNTVGMGDVSVVGSVEAPVAAEGGALRLQSGDKIKVIVFGEDRLSGDYDIDSAGSVSLPLAGTVQAAGLTKQELERELAKKFRGEYLRNPESHRRGFELPSVLYPGRGR